MWIPDDLEENEANERELTHQETNRQKYFELKKDVKNG